MSEEVFQMLAMDNDIFCFIALSGFGDSRRGDAEQAFSEITIYSEHFLICLRIHDSVLNC